MKYRDNMTADEAAALLAECAALDAAYAAAADAACDAEGDECEPFDPISDGWIGRDGQP